MSVNVLLNQNHAAEPWKDIRVDTLVVDSSLVVTSQAKGSVRYQTFTSAASEIPLGSDKFEVLNSNDIAPSLFTLDSSGILAVEESGQYLITCKIEAALGVFTATASPSLIFREDTSVDDIISADQYMDAVGIYTFNMSRIVNLSSLVDYKLYISNTALDSLQIEGGGNSYFYLLKI